jgi:hypothetical protein
MSTASCHTDLPKEHIALVQRYAAPVTSASEPDPNLELADAYFASEPDPNLELADEKGQDANGESRFWRRRRRSRRRRTPSPTRTPTNTPTKFPTRTPTNTPTRTPTNTPTKFPTRTPTNTPTDSPTQEPTASPTAPVFGYWTITRRSPWGKTKVDTVCGLETDILSIQEVYSKHCHTNQNGAQGQAVVNQEGKERTWAWYCSNVPATEIVGQPPFAADESCKESHNAEDDGT